MHTFIYYTLYTSIDSHAKRCHRCFVHWEINNHYAFMHLHQGILHPLLVINSSVFWDLIAFLTGFTSHWHKFNRVSFGNALNIAAKCIWSTVYYIQFDFAQTGDCHYIMWQSSSNSSQRMRACIFSVWFYLSPFLGSFLTFLQFQDAFFNFCVLHRIYGGPPLPQTRNP